MIEDVAAGVTAGKAARVLALTTTESAAELRVAGADWITTNLAMVQVEASGVRVRVRVKD